MMLRNIICILLLSSGIVQIANSQEEPLKKLTLDGYVSNMQTIMDMESLEGYWLYESQLHNRLNLNYYPTSSFTLSLQARNRFITGDRFKIDGSGQSKKDMAGDPGLFDLSFNLADGKSYVLNTSVDRLWLKYNLKKIEITLGRQRINWGQTLVWNPNDLFNNYSFFDFDYIEKPGSDAIRLQYYTGALSSVEAVIKVDSSKKSTAAVRYRMNFGLYDFQFLGGFWSGEDVAVGFGWAGGLGDIGFRGEMSYFHPVKQLSDTSGLFYFSLGLDYTFINSLMIQVEGLYCQMPKGMEEKSFLEFYQRPLSVKDISFTEWNFFAQVTYPFTPLLNGSLALLYYPKINGYYLGPSVTYSLAENFDFSFFIQWFSGEFPGIDINNERQNITMGFMRFKYNF